MDSDAGVKTVVIPSEINGIPVKKMGEEAFCGIRVKNLEFPKDLEATGDTAFYASSLEEVNFSEALRRIGGSAFGEVPELKKITMYDNVETIGVLTVILSPLL